MSYANLIQFVIMNKSELIEALNNHTSEIQSMMESADDDEYVDLNKKRNKLLKILLNKIKPIS